MVKLRRDSNGNFIARKRVPDDVRDEYKRAHKARHEAKFSAPASVGLHEAQRRFHVWDAEITGRFETIRKSQRGEGIDLNHLQAHALSGDWYNWFVGQREQEPGSAEQWDAAFWRLVGAMEEALPDDVQSDELGRDRHLLTEWAEYPEVHAAMRPIISDFGRTAQFLASRHVALTNAGRDRFLDAALTIILPALTLLERRAKGDYTPDELPGSFPKFNPPQSETVENPTSPRALFDEWVKARQPKQSTVESWRTVFNALTKHFKGRGASSITSDEAQVWLDGLITEERSAFTVRNTWLRAAKAVYTWALRRRKVARNPFMDAIVDVPKRTKHRPKHFYEDERTAILRAALLITDTTNPDMAARRWVPWLQAYTGARPSEITQLRGEDVKHVDRIWVLDLTPRAGSIKTDEARLVPIHSHLIDQGFLEFAKTKGDGPLFYRARKKQQGGTDPLTQKKSPAVQVRQRLADWVREIGVNDPHLSPLHAWRHTWKLIGRRVETSETLLDYICGHAPATVGRSYGVAELQDLARVIEKFPRYEVN